MSLDQRTRYSQMVIRESIFSLLQQKPFHKISVTDVCKQAGINRTTFYKYYQDLYDWKEQLEQECLHRVADILDISSLDDMQEMLTQKLQEIHDDGELYALISSPNFESSILNSIAILVLDKVDAEVKKHRCSERENDPKYKWDRCRIISSGFILLRYWFRNGMKEPPDMLAAYYTEYVRQEMIQEVGNIEKGERP